MLRIADDLTAYSGERLSALLATLPQWRREVALAYRHEEDRRESALAFRLLQDMLGSEYGILDEPRFITGEHGKPRLAGHPDIHFNLSHCRRAVACAVERLPVGVDIERTGRYTPRLAERVLSDDELRAVAAASDPDLLFTTLWTRKEALMKLLGTGITDDIRRVLHDYERSVNITTVSRPSRGYVCSVAQTIA